MNCWKCWWELKLTDAINITLQIKDTYVCTKCNILNFEKNITREVHRKFFKRITI